MSNPESYFPADYRQARRNFVAACEKAGVDSIARVHPTAKGPDGKPLFIDSVALGPRGAKKALLLISGTHGVEGYFGSAVQTGLLREGFAPPPGTRIVLVHALNPYGFAWDRRVNEDNVDLNRNYVDHAHPPENSEYAGLADAIAYEDASPDAVARADARLQAYASAHGTPALQDAISRGQYRFPKGLHFGGKARKLVAQNAAQHFDGRSGAGRKAGGDRLPYRPGRNRRRRDDRRIVHPDSAVYRRARAMWGGMVASSETGESVSSALTGTLDQALAGWLPKVELTFAALEVGTTSFQTIFNALRRDNWLYNFTPDQRLGSEIRLQCRAAFYPDNATWKQQVFGHAKNAVQGALAAL